ncbi:MAG TPA: serine/threonine-protein kinase [Gemmataceae bacterium]|nr:serine/threonine-protein kinase [Gemmataceae bacterium]
MPIDSVATFLTILQRMQVLTPQEVQEVTDKLGPHYSDPHDLARYLIEIDWLTEYQALLLFSDRWEELTVGPYLILDRLGEGGVSEVFKAWDTVKGRTVALKVLHQHLTDRTAAVREFQRELQAVTRLSHPNIIQTFDAHQLGALHYFAMEYIAGLDLDRYVRQSGALPIEQACEYIRQVAQGLQHAHQLGLVHRDIKPANLFLINPPSASSPSPGRRGSDAVIKILDWGLARVRPDAGGSADLGGMDLDTEKGLLIGTADYIAPEQARDPCLVDIRADIYSLGCTLYFLLTGQPPFPGASLMQKLLQHQDADRPQVCAARPDVPQDLAVVVQRMMARRPEERYAIPLLVAGALRHFAAGATGRPGSSPNLNLSKPSTIIMNLSARQTGTKGS